MFGLKDRLQTQVLAFCLVSQANRGELEMQHSALVKSTVAWCAAAIGAATHTGPGTPGSLACYCNYPFSLDLEINWPRGVC